MDFGSEKCAVIVMKSYKGHLTDGMDLPNKDKIRTLGEKETYKYLGIISECNKLTQTEYKTRHDWVG